MKYPNQDYLDLEYKYDIHINTTYGTDPIDTPTTEYIMIVYKKRREIHREEITANDAIYRPTEIYEAIVRQELRDIKLNQLLNQ